MRTPPKEILLVAALLAGSLPSRSPAAPGRAALIVVVRADGVDGSDLGGDPARTPRLRELSEGGITLPLLDLSSGAKTAGAAVDALFPAELLRQLEKRRLDPIRLTVRSAAGFTGADGEDAATDPQSALEELKRRFGNPGPVSPREREFLATVQRILALPFEGAPPSGSEATRPPRPVHDRIRRVIEDGARLVIVEQREAEASERDELVGELRSVAQDLRAQKTDAESKPQVTLAVLTIHARDGQGSLILHGPTLKRGWVLARELPLAAIGPTLLYILDPKLVSDKLETEILHDVFR